MAAGALLRGNGADATLGARTFQAVRAYNGAGPVAEAYARRVIDRARLWQTNSPPRSGDAGTPANRPTSGAGELTWPVRGPITSPFCERRAWEACHPGIDIAVPTGTPILAAATGRVTTRGPVSGYGLYTCLQHRPPLQTCYAHQSRLGPTPSGGIVPRGALVGYVGCTGRCFGAHLHFEVRVNDQPVDPLPYLTGGRAEMPRRDCSCSCSWSASWPGARTPTSKTARTTAAAQPRRSRPCQRRPHGDNVSSRAPARDTAPTIAANARATAAVGRERVLRPVDELELAHDRTPAATARRPRDRATRPPARGRSPSPGSGSGAAPRPPRRPRARRRDRRQTPGAPRAERSAWHGSNRSPTDAPTRRTRATTSTSPPSRARATAGRSANGSRSPSRPRPTPERQAQRSSGRLRARVRRTRRPARRGLRPRRRRRRLNARALPRAPSGSTRAQRRCCSPSWAAAARPCRAGGQASALCLRRARPASGRRADAPADAFVELELGSACSPPRPGASAETKPEHLRALLRDARAAHGLVVVDCGTDWDAADARARRSQPHHLGAARQPAPRSPARRLCSTATSCPRPERWRELLAATALAPSLHRQRARAPAPRQTALRPARPHPPLRGARSRRRRPRQRAAQPRTDRPRLDPAERALSGAARCGATRVAADIAAGAGVCAAPPCSYRCRGRRGRADRRSGMTRAARCGSGSAASSARPAKARGSRSTTQVRRRHAAVRDRSSPRLPTRAPDARRPLLAALLAINAGARGRRARRLRPARWRRRSRCTCRWSSRRSRSPAAHTCRQANSARRPRELAVVAAPARCCSASPQRSRPTLTAGGPR